MFDGNTLNYLGVLSNAAKKKFDKTSSNASSSNVANQITSSNKSNTSDLFNKYQLLNLVPEQKTIVNDVPKNSYSSFGEWQKAATTPASSKATKIDEGGTPFSMAFENNFAPSQNYQNAMAYTNQLLEKLSSGRTSYTDQINALMDQINNRADFSYDPNNDTLFQNYLSSMQVAGANAMQDTMGQAAALTGGYGSTYATTAGNQAYNNYIQGAYDNLDDYYGMALDTYNAEGNVLANKLGMYQTADDIEYNRLASAYSANAQAAAQMYDNEYNNYWKQKSYEYQLAKDQYDEEQATAKATQLKEPTSTQYQSALKAAQSGDVKGFQMLVDSYGDSLDTDAMVNYLMNNGIPATFFDNSYELTKATPNLIGNNNNNVISKKDSSGNVVSEMTVKQLYKQLIGEGFSEEAAKNYIEQMGYNATKLK